MNTIYNYPVIPEESSRHRGKKELPVTREDMQLDFRTGMQLYGNDWKTSPIFRQVFSDTRIASVMFGQWYGNVEVRKARSDTSYKGKAVAGWEKSLKNFYDMGIYIHSLNSLSTSEISITQHQAFKKIYGQRWLGHNEGEWDGAYIEQIARGKIDVSPERSRQEACLHYLDWLKETYRRHHNYMVTENALGFCHYSGECGTRMMGLELSQSLPSNSVLMSSCRGAGRQYDLLFITSPSVFAYRGHAGLKCYPKDNNLQSFFLKENYLAGPDNGATIGLLKRLWWLSYMNGASVVELEAGYFPCSADSEYNAEGSIALEDPVTMGKMMAHFTPIGWLQWESMQAAKRHPLRGVPYTPFAVILPFDHGWYPQPNLYVNDRENRTGNSNCVWGNIPFTPGDMQIDRFFDRIYPGYKLANWVDTRDERGIISNTPFGDSFDIILSNADNECLKKYQAIILLGEFDDFSSEHLPQRLEKFLQDGGTVITDNTHRHLLPADNAQCGKGRIILTAQPLQDAALEPLFKEYELLEIDGRPLYYLVNVTDRPDELLITLCNNSADMSWEGRVTVKGQEIVEAEEWLAYGEAGVENGQLRCGVPANNVRVYRVKTRRPFLSLRFSNIPTFFPAG